jgi:Ferritin-like domain
MSTPQSNNREVEQIEVQGITRQSFMLKGALATGAAFGFGAVGPYVANALGAGSSSDADILNFALTLEYLEANFYNVKAKSVGLSGHAAAAAALFGAQEQAHVKALTAAIKSLGGKPVAMPKFAFPANNQSSFLKLAYTLENVGVGAYNGAGPSLTSPKLLAAAGSIVQVEARHAATIGLLTSKPVTPDGAFDKPLPTSRVLADVKPLIK